MEVLRDYDYWINKAVDEYKTSQKKCRSFVEQAEEIEKRKEHYKKIYQKLLFRIDRTPIDIEDTALFRDLNRQIEEANNAAKIYGNVKSSEGYYINDIVRSILYLDGNLQKRAETEDDYIAKFYFACILMARSLKSGPDMKEGADILLELSQNEAAGEIAQWAANVYWIYHIKDQVEDLEQEIYELTKKKYERDKELSFYEEAMQEGESLKVKAQGILDQVYQLDPKDLDEGVEPSLAEMVNKSISKCDKEIAELIEECDKKQGEKGRGTSKNKCSHDSVHSWFQFLKK